MVLLTGSSGFVGSALIIRLLKDKVALRAVVRRENYQLPMDVDSVRVRELTARNDWRESLSRVDAVIHLAARVHVMHDKVADPMTEFRLVNVECTLNLARQAAEAGVRRFVFVSSIKVNGESTLIGHSFSAEDEPNPQDSYGISKHEAEQGLRLLAEETGMEVVIIRPPLVYGPGVKANFASMMSWLARGVPLPFGAIHNQRSLVALDNLVDFIVTCLEHPKAANQTFLVSDGDDMSTTQLLQRLGAALGKPARLIPVPVGAMQYAATLLGKGAVAQRLFGSLQVDNSKTSDLLGWQPVVSVEEAVRKTAEAFIAEHRK
jgi:nucleoside-diphosphate-sugar epimerase